ncbi:hypothetical protein JQ621_29670 [Bradyrhizobium manausense]|uniref:hypothetical protein n=1 Tax=Bradyrhizobium manausense TaxID=989370 RepID=UPI001BA57AA3|nr:hypothetical protein [Bradyrhizobium manausense]MBR1091645.1 hypothetical protein [Bradyrhizobium manausense]
MTNVAAFPAHASATASMAVNRLNEILQTVEAVSLRLPHEHAARADMMRMLRIFNTANSCVRIVLSDFRDDPAFDQLALYSGEIKRMIETAREKAVGLLETGNDQVLGSEALLARRVGD